MYLLLYTLYIFIVYYFLFSSFSTYLSGILFICIVSLMPYQCVNKIQLSERGADRSACFFKIDLF